jgi:phenylalanine-4-hydroxylase
MDAELLPPPHANADWIVPQDWRSYTPAEHAVWDTLFARQMAILPGRVVPAFREGVERLQLSKPGIPDFDELNERLGDATGWQVVAVPGLVPDEVFFDHLAHRRFVAGRFIRTPAQLDYLQEPDIFHDVFGHVPLLAHPIFADYMQAYGTGGLRAAGLGMIDLLARLYWYTVEFGLIRDGDTLKLYGAGIVSSHGESIFALDDPSPHRIGFDLERVMRTRYRIDDYQQNYFVIDSFEDLLAQTRDADFGPFYERLRGAPDIPIGVLLPHDRIISHGTQDYAHARQAADRIKERVKHDAG